MTSATPLEFCLGAHPDGDATGTSMDSPSLLQHIQPARHRFLLAGPSLCKQLNRVTGCMYPDEVRVCEGNICLIQDTAWELVQDVSPIRVGKRSHVIY
jgi:hypothetical protein